MGEITGLGRGSKFKWFLLKISFYSEILEKLLGVLAGQAGYSLYAFAANCLMLSGMRGIFSEIEKQLVWYNFARKTVVHWQIHSFYVIEI